MCALGKIYSGGLPGRHTSHCALFESCMGQPDSGGLPVLLVNQRCHCLSLVRREAGRYATYHNKDRFSRKKKNYPEKE